MQAHVCLSVSTPASFSPAIPSLLTWWSNTVTFSSNTMSHGQSHTFFPCYEGPYSALMQVRMWIQVSVLKHGIVELMLCHLYTDPDECAFFQCNRPPLLPLLNSFPSHFSLSHGTSHNSEFTAHIKIISELSYRISYHLAFSPLCSDLHT